MASPKKQTQPTQTAATAAATGSTMPDLPTITVTAAQATRIQNAFPGTTQAERVEAYKAWLRQAVRGMVKAQEQDVLRAKFEADVAASAATVDSDLTGI